MRTTIRATLFSLVSLASFAHAQTSPSPPQRGEVGQTIQAQAKADTSTDSIDDYIRAERAKHHTPGVSVAIIQDGMVVMAKGDGMASVELSVPATVDTVYQIGSTTKPFTATAIMLLVEDGELDLDDKITDHLTDLPESWSQVTVRHLLSHTGGIKNFTSVPTFRQTIRKDFGKRELLGLVTKAPLEFEPGEKFKYTNTGFFLLGMIIEEVSGKSYGAFLEERIFKPLDMTHTRVNDLRAMIPNRAQGYSWEGKTLKLGEYHSPTQPFAAGSLVSTVSDLMKWDAALDSAKLLKASDQELMWTPTTLSSGKKSDYGLGWQTTSVNGHRLVAHGGGIPGFCSQYLRFLDDKLTVIVLANTEGRIADDLAKGLAERLAERRLPSLKKPD